MRKGSSAPRSWSSGRTSPRERETSRPARARPPSSGERSRPVDVVLRPLALRPPSTGRCPLHARRMDPARLHISSTRATAVRALPRSQPTRLLAHLPSLLLSLVPGLVFGAGLVALSSDARFAWIVRPSAWPWQLVVIALAGTIATTAGVLDWAYHRRAGVVVGKHERRAELLALGLGGVPLFVLMSTASLAARPLDFLVPVLVLLVATVAMVVFDEVAFHRRRCAPVEHVLHRALTLGHFVAFLAWAHWVFVAERALVGGST